MAKKPSPEKPGPTSLLPGFQHLIPSAAAAPLAAHIRPLFLPDLVQQIARNKQIDANRREQAHPAFRKWAQDLKQGVLQQLHETQVEQDFNHVLLRGLGYTTQSDVASDQPWTLTPKWNVPGSGEVDAALGKFRLDESGSVLPGFFSEKRWQGMANSRLSAITTCGRALHHGGTYAQVHRH